MSPGDSWVVNPDRAFSHLIRMWCVRVHSMLRFLWYNKEYITFLHFIIYYCYFSLHFWRPSGQLLPQISATWFGGTHGTYACLFILGIIVYPVYLHLYMRYIHVQVSFQPLCPCPCLFVNCLHLIGSLPHKLPFIRWYLLLVLVNSSNQIQYWSSHLRCLGCYFFRVLNL